MNLTTWSESIPHRGNSSNSASPQKDLGQKTLAKQLSALHRVNQKAKETCSFCVGRQAGLQPPP